MGSVFYGQAMAIRDQGQIVAKRITQKSGNERRAVESDLARFSQALGNRKIMDAAGKNIGAYSENIAKNLEAATFGDYMTQIKQSEELGAMAAMAAAAGVGGSSIEAYNATIRTSNALAQEQSDRQLNRDLYAASMARGNVLTDAVGSFGQNIYRSDMDVTEYLDVKKPSFMSGVVTLGLTAAATYVGGPQAGQAVLGIREAQLAAQRGDYASASSSMTGALQAGIGAAKTTHDLGGNFWGSTRSKQANNDIVITDPTFKGISFGR